MALRRLIGLGREHGVQDVDAERAGRRHFRGDDPAVAIGVERLEDGVGPTSN